MNYQTPSQNSSQKKPEIHIVAGTYNQKGSQGIYRFSYNPVNSLFSPPELLARDNNPSFIHIDSNKFYVVNELGSGQLTTYEFGREGDFSKLASVETQGASPCYVSASTDKRFLATANYMGGNVSVFRVDDAGLPQANPQILQHSGHGPNKSRQESAHAHWVQWAPSQQGLYVVDLGIDEIKWYPFDGVTGKAGEGKTVLKSAPGDGPRHMVFHPKQNLVYVLNELNNTITVASIGAAGELTSIQKIDTLPESFTEHSQGAHIAITQDGKTLYTSNRGHNSIAVFSIDDVGHLSLIDLEPTQGNWPRHFLLLENANVILVANQESNNIVALNINSDGTLSSAGAEMSLPQVTFLGRF